MRGWGDPGDGEGTREGYFDGPAPTLALQLTGWGVLLGLYPQFSLSPEAALAISLTIGPVTVSTGENPGSLLCSSTSQVSQHFKRRLQEVPVLAAIHAMDIRTSSVDRLLQPTAALRAYRHF